MTKKIYYGLFCVAAIFLFFFYLGHIPLWSSDEGRYGEIAREMLESKDFVVPHFNYLPFLDKPILAPALTAFSYGIFGVNEFSTRMWPAIFALLGLYCCYRFVRKLFGVKTAEMTTIVLLTTIGYVLVGRFAVIDMLMTFFLSMTLFSLLTAFAEQDRRFYLLAYVFMGLSFLTKGLIGIVLPGLVFLMFLIWTRNLSEIKKMHMGWGCLIVAAIILPWCIAVSMREPHFFYEFIINQHFGRFLSGSYGRKRPVWFFLPILIGTGFPWTFFLPAAVVQGLGQDKPRKTKIQFMICWIVAVLVFFSIPKSKLPYYILPVCMPLAVLTGSLFSAENFSEKTKKWMAWIWRIFISISVLAALGLSIFLLWFTHRENVLMLRTMAMIGSAVLVLSCILSYLCYRRGKVRTSFMVLSGIVYIGLISTIVAMGIITPQQSHYEYVEVLRPLLQAGDHVAVRSSPDRFSDLPFYLKRKITIVGTDRGTMTRASMTLSPEEESQYFIYDDEYIRLFNSKTSREFFFMKKDALRDYDKRGFKDYRIIKEDNKIVLVTNT